MPSMERLRFTSSGTEAVMSAVRVARAATGRDLIVKFAGAYHGHSDGLLVDAGSGVATQAIAGSAGVPDAVAATTIVLPFNDADRRHAGVRRSSRAGSRRSCSSRSIANAGVIAPEPGFLELLRELTRADGALLVFDEVITGFRLGPGGAQARFGDPAGPDDARQDHRRRDADRRVRRPGRPDGPRRAGRPGLPGRDAVGPPAVDGRRDRDAGRARRRSATSPSRRRPPSSPRASPTPRPRRAATSRSPGSGRS